MTRAPVPTAAQVRAYLDDLAALSTAHGLMIEGYKVRLGPAEATGSPFMGGYAAVRRPWGAEGWWEVYPYPAHSKIRLAPATDDGRTASIDIVTLTAHQRLDLEAALRRVREILHGPA